MVDAAVERLHGLDGVVYNVGVGEGLGLDGTTAESWDRVLGVNLRGAMLDRPGGAAACSPTAPSIVFISSVAGHAARQPHPVATTRRRPRWPG